MNNEVIEMLKKSGGVITDSHIVYTSGKHGSIYINKDALYPHTEFTSRVGELFAESHKDLEIDVVAAPALGGIILETWTAYHLSKLKNREVLGIYTEKDAEKNQIFTRGYDKLVKDKNVLVIEDLTTTGKSVLKVVNTVKKTGGNVVAVGVMVNRDPENVNSDMMGVPFSSLAVLKAEAYDESECPLCQQGIPINTEVGHGKKYLEAKKHK
ncbi:phosphoribosyltransferase [Candidatus Gottesmanbacteria bacterium]|nr:phosphoribosyltransferase [Candidatus Gottesmanbacteria bacterium]